jgi:molybdenum cofactor cytidylyltransferase
VRPAVAAVVLAAGASRRFGGDKLLAPIGGVPLVRLSVRTLLASSVDDIVVVVARGDASIREAIAGLAVRCVEATAGTGVMSDSLRAGIAAVTASAAAIVALADQPTVPAEVVDRLIDEWRSTRSAIVAPRYAGERGNPVLFDGSLFAELLVVEGDRGAREVIAREPGRVRLIDLPFAMPADVDTREDWEALARERR